MKTSPRLFFCSGCGTRHVPFPGCLLAPCPLSLTVGSRAPPLPALLVALSGRVAGRGLSCRRAVRWGLSIIARSPCRAAACLPAFFASVFDEVGGPAFLVLWLSAIG